MFNVGVIYCPIDMFKIPLLDHPRDVVSQMQHLLHVVEDHGTQLHMNFGKEKCRLLISARPKMIKSVEKLLKDGPEILTFYGNPVTLIQYHQPSFF